MTQGKAVSEHFFRREADGSVRIRLRLTPEEAALIEEGAGKTPLILYIHRVLNERARYHVRQRENKKSSRRNVERREEDDDYRHG